jgi:hypothetical protein
VKDSNPDVHVRVLKASIGANGERDDAEIVNLFCYTFRDIDRCNNYMGDYLDCTFVEL